MSNQNWKPVVELVSITPKSEEVIETAYRNCWQSEPKYPGDGPRRTFIRKLINKGHHSCLEFATAAFRIKGSRAFSHQLVRHRMASYAQESQRYVKITNDRSYVIPPNIAGDPEALELYQASLDSCRSCYQALLDLGIAKQDARFILPNAARNTIIVGMNFRSWRQFLELRCDRQAQWEIRSAAMEILDVLYEHAPGIFEDIYQRFNN